MMYFTVNTVNKNFNPLQPQKSVNLNVNQNKNIQDIRSNFRLLHLGLSKDFS